LRLFFGQLQKCNSQVQHFILQLIFTRSSSPNISETKWSKTMRKLSSLILAATALSFAVPASAAEVERNDRLYDATGSSVAKVNRITETGDLLVIYKGKVRRIEASTLSESEGKLMTSLTKSEIRRLD
jgi:hypothetical protein